MKTTKEKVRKQTLGEEIANAISHGIGFGLAIAALAALLVVALRYGDAWYIASFSIYGASLVLLYLFSTLYHSLPEGKAKRVFRIFDHSSIFLLIAGTYTPITLLKLPGALGWALFGTIWGLTLVGIIFKAVCLNKLKVVSTLLYIGMGWMAVIAIKPLLAALSKPGLWFLLIGGLFYTVGTLFYARKGLKYAHFVWHCFVLSGSICHFFMVWSFLPA